MENVQKLGVTQVFFTFKCWGFRSGALTAQVATWFWQLQPFLYIEKPSHRGSKAGECSA